METCKKNFLGIILSLFLIFIFTNFSYGSQTFKQLENRKVSYLDFFLLKLENTINKRVHILRSQLLATRVQYSNIGIQVDFNNKKEEIFINMYAIMDKKRYSKKKYIPKISDCNILRNILLYGKYGYNLIFLKRNTFLTNADMEEIFLTRFLHNLSLSKKEKNYILNNTLARVQVIDPVRGNDVFCTGKIARDLE